MSKISGVMSPSLFIGRQFPLRNILGEKKSFRKITIIPEFPPNYIVADIRVGMNSQVLSSGTFRASILNRLPPIDFDPAPVGTDFTLVIGSLKQPPAAEPNYLVEVSICNEALPGPSAILPAGPTCMPGRVVRVVTTQALFEAMCEKKAVLTVATQFSPYGHQLQGDKKSNVSIHNENLFCDEPLRLEAGEYLRFKIEGPGADCFDPKLDAVAVLQMDSPPKK